MARKLLDHLNRQATGPVNWLEVGSNLDADLDGDSDVDLEDLKRFTDEWLYCCPYNWPLK